MDMQKKMHSPEMKKKVMGTLIYGLIMNAVMAGIFGWWAFPSSNMDMQVLYGEKLDMIEEWDMTTEEWRAQIKETLERDYSDEEELAKAVED